MPREKSCGAVVYKKDSEGIPQYLLLNYGAHWDFVKGQVEVHESEKETALRELSEETGITNAKLIRGFKETISYYYRRRGRTVYKEVVYFLVHAMESNVRLSFEHVGYAWLGYEQAMKKLTFKNAQNVLTKAHGFFRRL
jgi:bis(5'-nucleosidyl)-tetraphosphatase